MRTYSQIRRQILVQLNSTVLFVVRGQVGARIIGQTGNGIKFQIKDKLNEN
jgi:hypothetical protein